MRITRLIPFLILLRTITFPAFAQNTSPAKPKYPQNYFRNPLNIPILLAGNFGECRPGHFHSGLDIKTEGKENQPVFAAADGYISRIKMDKGGFGHAIYIAHPNGYTTLYAHLNKFSAAIQKYLREQQYKEEKWDIDIQIPPAKFPVKKGQQIAWSGNTGSSTAPHLHFEIRDGKNEHPLNPQLFGLPVVDKKPPVPVELVLYEIFGYFYEREDPNVLRDKRVLVDKLVKKGNIYVPAINLKDKSFGMLGIGINTDDFMEGSDNTLGIYTAKLYLDDSLQAAIRLEDIGYDVTRYVNAYADYYIRKKENKWVQCFFKLPGNHLDNIYEYLNANNGWLKFKDELLHHMRIELADVKGNKSTVEFDFKGGASQATQIQRYSMRDVPVIYLDRIPKEYGITTTVKEKELYSDVVFHLKKEKDSIAYSDRYTLMDPYTPVHHSFELSVKANKAIPPHLRSKIALMYSDGKDTSGKYASYADSGWCSAKVREFGTYWLVADTVAPVIKSKYKDGAELGKAEQILIEAKEAVTSIRKYSGTIDGKWVCFEQHGEQFFYEMDEHCPKGKHELEFTVSDENGNTRTIHFNFSR